MTNAWKQIKEKVKGYDTPAEYISDEQRQIVRPGLRFWEYLGLANPKIEKPRIWIPQTLVNCSGNQQFMLWTDPRSGRIMVNQDASYIDFEKILLAKMEATIKLPANFQPALDDNRRLEEDGKKKTEDPEKRAADLERRRQAETDKRKQVEGDKRKKILEEKKQFLYFYAMRTRVSGYENDAMVEVYTYNKWAQGRSNQIQFDDNSILQEYIYPRGPKACITRLVYFTKHNKEMKANFGFKLRNRWELHQDSDRLGVEDLATVNKSPGGKINAFTVNRIYGPSLAEYEVYAKELVSFLERAYAVRINMAVLDFITDQNKRQVLFNVKHLDLEHMLSTPRDIGEKKRTLDELTCSVYCKLCGLIFKKDEASKTLTYKLLWELAQHLKKRGKQLKDIEVSHSSTRPCRVCDLCYMVVVSEHELIELEQEFARVQNIPIVDPYLRVPIEKKAKHRPALLNETLKQWRFMIYLQNLYFEGPNLFKKHSIDQSQVHLQVKLFRIKNDWAMDLLEMPFDPDRNVEKAFDYTHRFEINLLRVYYFFSETTDIKTFLQESELQIRLTYNKDWNNYIAQGSTKTLSHFENNRIKGQKHESLIYMFFDSAEYCTVKFMAGLVCDGDFNTASMNLHKYHGIYFPNDDFYNCNIFPQEWIEIFMEDGETYDLEDYDAQEKKVQPYTPVCTPAELKKMLEPNHRSTKYKIVGHEIDNRLDEERHEENLRRFHEERVLKEEQKRRPYSMYTANEVGSSKGMGFRINSSNKPKTADPRRNPQKEPTEEVDRNLRSQVRQYLDQNIEAEEIRSKAFRQEFFDESNDYERLEEEYGTGKPSKQPTKRLPSAQDHRNFLNRQMQDIAEEY